MLQLNRPTNLGKLSNGHRTEKGQFSFQSQRRAVPKNVQTTENLCSFHMLARLCSKSFKLDFNSMWMENFQMYKLGFEEAEEPQIKLATLVGWWRTQGSSRKTSTSASLSKLNPSLYASQPTGKFLKRQKYQVSTTLPVSWETWMWIKK